MEKHSILALSKNCTTSIKERKSLHGLYTEDNNIQLEKDSVMVIPYKYVLYWENVHRKKQGRM
jgi:hypothetical protein